jgi:tetratricopeptide (TPR) repeat protein
VALWQILIQSGHTFFPFIIARNKFKNDIKAGLKAKILLRLMYTYWFFNSIKCLAVAHLCLNIAEHIGPSKILCQIYSAYGIVLSTIPLFNRALRYQFRSLAIGKELNEPWAMAQTQGFLGLMHYYLTEWDKSIDWLWQGINGLAKLGDKWEYILYYIHLGYQYRNKSDFAQSIKCFQSAYDAACQVRDLRSMGQSLSGLCEVLAFKGDVEKAEQNIVKAVEYCEKASDLLVRAMALRDYAQVLLQKGDYQGSIEQALRSNKLIVNNFLRSDYVVPTYLVLAAASLKLAERTEIAKDKKRLMRQAYWAARYGLFSAVFYKNYLGYAYRVNGTYYCLRGNRRKGEEYLLKSRAILEKQGNKYELGKTMAEIANLYPEIKEK